MSYGTCFSVWCPRRRRGLRAVADVGTATGKCWRRSCSSPPRAVPGNSCPRRRSDPPARPPIGAKLPPPGPRRARCPRRAGLVPLRDRLGEHEGLEKGDLTGLNPVDRGKFGSKIHLITERTGLPLSVGIAGANMHDSLGLEPLVRGISPIRSRRGPLRRRPGKLHADKGYEYAHLRRWLCGRGITHRIARRGIESSQRLGLHPPSPASPAPSSVTENSPSEMTLNWTAPADGLRSRRR